MSRNRTNLDANDIRIMFRIAETQLSEEESVEVSDELIAHQQMLLDSFSDYLNDLLANGTVLDLMREHVIAELESISRLGPPHIVAESVDITEELLSDENFDEAPWTLSSIVHEATKLADQMKATRGMLYDASAADFLDQMSDE